MKITRIIVSSLAIAIALNFQAAAQTKTAVQRYVDSISRTGPLATAIVGVHAERADGTVIVDFGGTKKMIPASNAKILSTGMALHTLGKDFRFTTSLAYSGEVEEGTLKGDLYIVGGGDPTLFSRDSIAKPDAAVYALWRRMLSDAGIRKIDGDIIGDGRFIDGQPESGSWLYEDIGTYYGTGMDGLCFYRNAVDFSVSPGAEAGDALKISGIYPRLPWMKYSYSCATGKAGTGDMLYLYTTGLSDMAELRGTLASDIKSKTVRCSNKFGSYTCALMLRNNLTANGIQVTGKAAFVDRDGMVCSSPGETVRKAAAQTGLVSIGEMQSPELSRIARMTNYRSDNLYAETLLRMTAKHRLGSASYDSCPQAAVSVLKGMGLDPSTSCNLIDGSGLSRKDLVSPSFLCSFLKAMLNSPEGSVFVSSLPHPPGRTARSADASKIYYKTGSMEGVRCWSGYIFPDGSDAIVFSIMVNNYTGSSGNVTSRMSQILERIATE